MAGYSYVGIDNNPIPFKARCVVCGTVNVRDRAYWSGRFGLECAVCLKVTYHMEIAPKKGAK